MPGNAAASPAGDERIEAAPFEPTAAKGGPNLAFFSAHRVALLAAVGVAAAAAWVLWFLFTATSVRFEVTPASADVTVDGGFALRLAETRLLREGRYRLRATAQGHQPLEQTIEVGTARNQTVVLDLARLPGRVTFAVDPPDALVEVAGQESAHGEALVDARIPAGPQVATVSSPRYQPATVAFEVEGMERAQTVTVALAPNWSDVTIPTTPAGAAVHVDDEPTGAVTPGPAPVLAGTRRLSVQLAGHKTWTDIVRVRAGEQRTLPPVALERADGLVRVKTTPRGAAVTLDGAYLGETPLEFTARPGKRQRLRLFKVGYAPRTERVAIGTGRARDLAFTLERLHGELALVVQPEDAELWLDGARHGAAGGVLTLPAVPHEVEIKKAGHASYRKTVTPQPGFTQELKVRLLTLEEARLEALKRVRTTSQGQELVLLEPGVIRMGASRREPGRRANEVLRTATLTRLFYLGRREVTNAAFRAFMPKHASGAFQNFDLDNANQPVVNVSWVDAARYCNWLSKQDGLAPFYTESDGRITGFDGQALGYRLPTEAEWAWAARSQAETDAPRRFAWGDKLPPPDRFGNYADQSAAHVVGRIVFGYNDNHIVSAPVGRFAPNDKGLQDLDGNVAEWTHDFYAIPDGGETVDPLGPDEGPHRVIRGASWMRGTVTDLRLAYRDYGTDGRLDVGFRIARFAE